MDRNEFEKHAGAYVEGLLNKTLTRELDAQRGADPECDKFASMHELVMDTLDCVERVKPPVGLTERIVAATEQLEEESLEEISFRRRAFKISFGLCFSVVFCGLILTWIVMKGEMSSLALSPYLSQWQLAGGYFSALAEQIRQGLDFLGQPLPTGIEALKLPVAFIFSFFGSLVVGIIGWFLIKEEKQPHRLPVCRITR